MPTEFTLPLVTIGLACALALAWVELVGHLL